MPTYSGGLGVLAGDTLRAGADMGQPMIGITLLNRKGYFKQHLDEQGNQTESPDTWNPSDFLEPGEADISIIIEGRKVKIKPWRYVLTGVSGHHVPVYFLDTATPENSPWDQTLTDNLYGGDSHYRLCQEAVLGIGGVATLRALGYTDLKAYHMNEGHSALLILALMEEQMNKLHICSLTEACSEEVRELCVFTTHTPVAAAIDQFPMNMVNQVLGADRTAILQSASCFTNDTLNMTFLGLCFSHYINGVSMRHEEISHGMFPNYPINSITNGVHAATWTSPPLAALYDKHIPEWRKDNLYLRYCVSLPVSEILKAHSESKQLLFTEINKRSNIRLDKSVLTIGFARRATGYKRAGLLFSDIDRLRQITQNVGPIQIIYSGKAHPRDSGGKDIIRGIFKAAEELKDSLKIVYLEEYNMELAKYICGGVDIWLNTPQKPIEASGTSGMKAALNGVPSFSILDGWWVEGHVEGVTGWSIGENWELESHPEIEIASLYTRPTAFGAVMRNAIALNGSYYNSQRMLSQYINNAYFPDTVFTQMNTNRLRKDDGIKLP
jgi:starch phosphorylase